MPTVRYCARSGDNKRAIAAMNPGDAIIVPFREAAKGLYSAARHMGMKIRVRQVARGQLPCRVTMIGPRPAKGVR